MAYIQSYSTLAGHPKVKRMARSLEVSENEVIGILHRLWWWAVDYAPDGDLTDYDSADIAEATGWSGDPDELVKAMIAAGGRKAGFLEQHPGVVLIHDWDEGGGKAPQALEKASRGGTLGNHRRWHVARGESDPECPHCITTESQGESDPESGGDHSTDQGANRRGEESRGDKRKPSSRVRAKQLPSDWKPNDTHQRIAGEERVVLEREETKFRDHHTAKGSRFKDWDAAFRTWLHNAGDYQRQRGGPAASERYPGERTGVHSG